MDSIWISVLILGLAGMDPVGALLGTTALAGGSKRALVVAYGLIVILTTIIVGTLLSLTSATFSFSIDWSFTWVPENIWALGQLAAGAVLMVFGWRRWHNRGNKTSEKSGKKFGGALMLIGTGFLYGVTAPIDPTFIALSVLVGQTEHLLTIVAAHTTWILISQLPLTILTVAIMMNRHHAVMKRIQSMWDRIRPYFSHGMTVLVSGAGAFLILEVGWWMTSGSWFSF